MSVAGRAAGPAGAETPAMARRFSPGLAGYLAFSRLAGPLAGRWLVRRAAQGREDPERLGERLGRPGTARPAGRLIWMHGASAGEAVSLVPLAEELVRQGAVSCLLTAGTVAAARRLDGELPAEGLHQYAPVDTATAVRGFFDHWRPDLAIRAESELWPRTLVETARRGVPMLLVNARVSGRSARRWAWAPGMARALLGLFARIEAQDAESAARIVAMGAEPGRVRAGGSLKAAVAAPACDLAALEAARAAVAGRPVWLAASTHAPEEEVAGEAHRIVARTLPGLLTVIAPRHPERGAAVAAALRGRGLKVARLALGEALRAETEIWLADTLGEMGLWLRLAPVAFIGGSLAAAGGHTPFEAAALGAAVLHGPRTGNLATDYAALDTAGGARVVTNAAELAGAVAELLGSEASRSAMAGAAREVRRRRAPDVVALATEVLALVETRR